MVVVLPEPLTPTTRITCGRGKASISSGTATGARIFSSSSATISRTAYSVRPRSNRSLGEPGADLRRGRRAEVGGDQRLLDLVERLLVERGLGEQAGEIVAEPVRGLAEARLQPVEPGRLAHAATPTRVSPSTRGDASTSTHLARAIRRMPVARDDGPARNSRRGRGRPSRPAPAAASRPAPPATPPCAARRPRAAAAPVP